MANGEEKDFEVIFLTKLDLFNSKYSSLFWGNDLPFDVKNFFPFMKINGIFDHSSLGNVKGWKLDADTFLPQSIFCLFVSLFCQKRMQKFRVHLVKCSQG